MNIPDSIIAITVLILVIGSAMLIAFVYVKTPSKRELLLYGDRLVFKVKDYTDTIKLAELSEVNLYIDKSKYFIGITENDNETVLELDIIFQNEKNKILETVKSWSDRGFQAKITNKDELSKQARLKKSTSNTYLKHDFSRHEVKIQPGFPFKAKTIIPYTTIPKKALFVLSVEAIEELNWSIVDYSEEKIECATDSAFKSWGNRLSVMFKDRFMLITCEDYGGTLFPAAAKSETRSFLNTLSQLSNELDLRALEERYDSIDVFIKAAIVKNIVR